MGLNGGMSMDILKKINKLRLDRNWSIYRLSLESGIPQSTITNMFNRETLPSIPTLESICKAFGITMSDFFKDENEISSYEKKNSEFLILIDKLSKQEKDALLILLQGISKK